MGGPQGTSLFFAKSWGPLPPVPDDPYGCVLMYNYEVESINHDTIFRQYFLLKFPLPVTPIPTENWPQEECISSPLPSTQPFLHPIGASFSFSTGQNKDGSILAP